MIDYDPFSDEMRDDPFPVYARLRAESPVHYVERRGVWALSLFEDVWHVGENPQTFTAPGPSLDTTVTAEVLQAEDQTEVSARSSIFGMNPPQHTQLRKQLTRHFSPRGVAHLEHAVRSLARDCIAKALSVGRLDVIDDLAGQVSARVVCLTIGLPVEDGPQLAAVVKRFFAREPGIEGMPPDGMAASGELRGYLLDAVRERRRRGLGDGDVLDAYLQVAIDGRAYSDEELASHLTTLVVGGTETLPKVFAGGVLQLDRHPEQRAELVADPSLIPTAFTEIARYEMPTQFLSRTATRDVELRGQKIRAGQGVLLLYRSANRDAREFDDPDRFDIHRRAPRILSFGHGTHLCLGQHAARLEARVMYEELLSASPEYQVVEHEVVRARSEFVDGYLQMPIVFGPPS
ncbi:MAG: cytochrome P450 [Myxococcota bacterium]|nr:cytochrome P450 [Myxococcota bacterium]MEE2673984.1 cytochrome P450 [Myxococcota bacterium]